MFIFLQRFTSETMAKKKKEKEITDNERFDQQEHLMKYITGFFGYINVKVTIDDGWCGEGDEKHDIKIITVNSIDKSVYKIMQSFFGRIVETTHINDEGELEMIQTITYDEKDKMTFIPYFKEWEKELNQILFDFIRMTLKPMI